MRRHLPSIFISAENYQKKKENTPLLDDYTYVHLFPYQNKLVTLLGYEEEEGKPF